MGWLRLVGSMKLQVSFAEYGVLYRALLQKRDISIRPSFTVETLMGGWLRLVGSMKLQVSFAEYSLLYIALLQKRPMI